MALALITSFNRIQGWKKLPKSHFAKYWGKSAHRKVLLNSYHLNGHTMTDEKFRPSEIVEQYYRDLKDFVLRLAFLRTLRVFSSRSPFTRIGHHELDRTSRGTKYSFVWEYDDTFHFLKCQNSLTCDGLNDCTHLMFLMR